MDYGGNHKVSVPSSVSPDEVAHAKSFDCPNPNPQEEFPVNAMWDSAVDPLEGKSGKDSLTEDQATLMA